MNKLQYENLKSELIQGIKDELIGKSIQSFTHSEALRRQKHAARAIKVINNKFAEFEKYVE